MRRAAMRTCNLNTNNILV